MPATAGRVRMPANNRVHSSAALQTHGIWQSAIGYDPYAPNKEDSKQSSQPKSATSEPETENAYASFQGLLALARITGSNADEARGACKKCGRVGHLTFQCRNFLSLKDDKEKDQDVLQAAVASGLDKLKAGGGRMDGKGLLELSEESSDESESSDSDVDSEMERLIAARNGKKSGSKSRSSGKKKDASDEDDSDSKEKRKRGRSKKRRSKKRISSDSEEEEEEGDRERRKEKRRRHDSSDEDDERRHRHRKSRKEKRRRRSHRHSEDSDEESDKRRKRKSRKHSSQSDSDVSGSDDSRVGRDKKRSAKRSGKHRHREAA